MASRSSTRFVLMMVVLCLLAILCEGRGARGRVARFRVRGKGSGSGSGGGNVGLIVGIIFGVIGGTVLIVVVYFLCRAYCFKNSSGNSVKDNGSQDVDLDNTNANTDQPYYAAATTTVESSYNPNGTDNGVLPPSYDSAIDQKEGVPCYPSQPNGGPPETLYPAYPSEAPDEVKGFQY